MSDKLANRPAQMAPILRNRWSPRAFSSKPIPADEVTRLFEAAQWAMSCFNGQPWRFVYATKDDAAAHARIVSVLAPANQTWAAAAPLIGISIGRDHFEHNGDPNRWAAYDTGAAMALLTVQAESDGLKVHQMGGFDREKAKQELGIPEGHTPMAAFVVGYIGDPATLSDQQRERELAPGSRKALGEIAFRGTWGGN